MPAKGDSKDEFLFRHDARIRQLKEFLETSAVIARDAQRYLINALKGSSVAFVELELEVQNELRNNTLLKQRSQKHEEAFRVKNGPTPKLYPEEALQFCYPYFEANLKLLRGWLGAVFRALTDDLWDGRANSTQIRGAAKTIILGLIEAARKDFVTSVRCDVLSDCYVLKANAYTIEFPDRVFKLLEQDFNRLADKLRENWTENIDVRAWKAEQRITAKEKQEATERERAQKRTLVVQPGQKIRDPKTYPFMTVPEVKELIGKSTPTIYRYLNEGPLKKAPQSKKGGSVLILTKSVAAFLNESSE